MRYLSSVYVGDHRSRISRSKGSLIVTTEGRKSRVPLEGIDAVTLLGGAHITTDAIAACAERNIRVSALRRGGAVRFTVGGPRGGNVHLRVAQHRASADPVAAMAVARVIVAAKMQSSRRVILRWGRDADPRTRDVVEHRADAIRDRIGAAAGASEGDRLRGIEGDAARSYFSGMAVVLATSGIPMPARSRRPPRDPVNALLSFGYGLLMTEVVGACESAGLDHQVGFLHRPRSGRPSLALDLMEELRPVVDRIAVRTLRRRELTAADFSVMPGGGTYLTDDARSRYLRLWESSKEEALPHSLLDRPVERWALPAVQATLLARHLRGDLPRYPPFVLAV